MPDQPNVPPTEAEVSEQRRVRQDKRARLLAEGRQAYPVSVPRTHALREVRSRWASLGTGEETQDVVSVAGRVVFLRNTGKLCFATLQEGLSTHDTGTRLQVMLSLAEVGQEALDSWKADVDLGDFVSVTGRVVSSRRGELSVMAGDWVLASKALRPLPNLYADAGLSEETRVRQRYADLTVREEARQMVLDRARVTRSIRDTLHRHDFVEVESPVLQLVHGGAHARPFPTHLNAFDIDMTLRIALELFLKRAVVGGVDRVYEMGRIFRNEGVDSTHSPEFTMLEFYEAWGDQRSVAELTRQIVLDVADVLGSRQVETPAGTIDLDGEWRWLGVYPGLSEVLGEEVTPETSLDDLRALAAAREVTLDPAWGAEKVVLELFAELVEPTLLQPTFVCDYPPSAQPLARPHRSDPALIEAWDLFIGGVERGTGFSELIDPVVQRERLTAQSLEAAAGDPEAMQLDDDFLDALEFGAPPMGGVGLGLDRLIMLFSGAGIRETILFPLLRPGS
ncbi:lysyl-tRNA synthetase, class II [Microlunatus sagamiharensis]|uniref:Lysine--tRNA ligase n=1 Tax=Microlunatus sagamiharensis TaxID=546874 RepID=A0A1H2N9M4_9ACTN|nr:lysine--tRNA ligase [Microlunatus sagamiharensis]SDV01506.1 lysyl-tRNA synthetase, class II [Microlunatus sagamiharensis]